MKKQNVKKTAKIAQNDFPDIKSRWEWGLKKEHDIINRELWPPEDRENHYFDNPSSTHVFLHATGDKNAYNNFYFYAGGDWEQYIKNQIWVAHTEEKDFGDIGYHFIIDPNGIIYEGRLTSLEMVNDPNYFVKGAHLVGGNSYAVGIALLSLDGDFSVDHLSHLQLQSLIKLSAAIFEQQGIEDPRESAEFFVHGSYYRIEGHRTWEANHGRIRDCPGENVYNRLLELRNLVYNYMNTILDTDEDFIPDEYDNCPEVYNPDQEDWNANGIGDQCDISPCQSQAAFEATEAMQICLDLACADLQLAKEQKSEDFSDCLDIVLNNANPIIGNEYIYRSAWVESDAYNICVQDLDLLDEDENVIDLTEEQEDELYTCIRETVHNYAVQNGYDPNMTGTVDPNEYEYFLIEICECNKDSNLEYFNDLLNIATTALQCYNATGETCGGVYIPKECPSKDKWSDMIEKAKMNIKRFTNLDCSTQVYHY